MTSSAAPVRILGIDPGSRLTGFGLIETVAGRSRCVAHEVLKLGDGELPGRLLKLLNGLREFLREHKPDEIAMEEVFVKRNVSSALVLGQARGAAICAVAEAGFALHEYAPASIKQAITGNGRAEKSQMQLMVRRLLNLQTAIPEDAADALACALCHAHSRTMAKLSQRVLQAAAR